MKKIINISLVLLLISACYPAKYVGSYGNINQAVVSLSEPNYNILGSFTGRSTNRSKFEFNYTGMIAEARKDLWQNASKRGIKQEGSKLLMNVNVEILYHSTRRVAIVTGEIIEFKKASAQTVKTYSNTTSQKETSTAERDNSKKKEEAEKKVELEKKEGGFKKVLDKVSEAFSKDNKTEKTSEEKTVENKNNTEKPQFTNCSLCNATGHISSTCTSEGCVKGKLNEKCNVCNGKYSEGNAECFRCEGKGCDYCGYDGKACDACKEGIKSSTHSVCNGTGEIVKDCTKCAGTGKVKL